MIDRVEVIDKDGNVGIKMTFDKIEFDKKFSSDYFELSSIIDTSSDKKNSDNKNTNSNDSNIGNNNSTGNDTNNNQNSNIDNNSVNDNGSNDDNQNSNTEETKTTASIRDIVYPMYLPENTYLASEKTISTSDGERLILTFDGDSSFTLVEEVSNLRDSNVVIPVIGNMEFLADVIGVVGDNSISWDSNGVEYYMVSNNIPTSELINIAKSISVLPVSK